MTDAPRSLAVPALTGPVLVALGALAIGLAPIGLRVSEFGPQATAFWRFALALPLLAFAAHRSGGIGVPTLPVMIAGAFFGGDIALWHASLTLTSVANATFIVNLGNVLAGLIAWFALKQTPSRIWPFAAALALAGAFLLSRGATAVSLETSSGDLLALGAAVLVSVYLVLTAIARRKASAFSILFWATCSALIVAAAACAATGETIVPATPSWLLVPAGLAVVAHFTGQGLIVAGLGRTPASIAGILLLIQPVASALIAWGLFQETLTQAQLGGCGLILAGIWLSRRG